MEGPTGGAWISDRDLVDSVLRDLAEAADRWEALVAQAETVTYSVDMGDIRAVANSDGKLVDLVLHPNVTTDYTHGELAERLNTAFAALRAEVEEDYRARYGGELE
jgi:hypothetical protein